MLAVAAVGAVQIFFSLLTNPLSVSLSLPLSLFPEDLNAFMPGDGLAGRFKCIYTW